MQKVHDPTRPKRPVFPQAAAESAEETRVRGEVDPSLCLLFAYNTRARGCVCECEYVSVEYFENDSPNLYAVTFILCARIVHSFDSVCSSALALCRRVYVYTRHIQFYWPPSFFYVPRACVSACVRVCACVVYCISHSSVLGRDPGPHYCVHSIYIKGSQQQTAFNTVFAMTCRGLGLFSDSPARCLSLALALCVCVLSATAYLLPYVQL